MASSSSSLGDQVFLSCAEDTCDSVASDLRDALEREGFHVLMGDGRSESGEEIGGSVEQAIERSRVAIIVFSPEYPSSRRRLDEVVKIMECQRSKGQVVIPIFYKVDVSEVREQSGRYGEAIEQHVVSDGVLRLRQALTEVANLVGCHSPDSSDVGQQTGGTPGEAIHLHYQLEVLMAESRLMQNELLIMKQQELPRRKEQELQTRNLREFRLTSELLREIWTELFSLATIWEYRQSDRDLLSLPGFQAVSNFIARHSSERRSDDFRDAIDRVLGDRCPDLLSLIWRILEYIQGRSDHLGGGAGGTYDEEEEPHVRTLGRGRDREVRWKEALAAAANNACFISSTTGVENELIEMVVEARMYPKAWPIVCC